MRRVSVQSGIESVIGPTINAQFTLTWDTQQTLGQYLEILDGEEFTIEGFTEYVRDNALETISQLEQIELDSYLSLVSGEGAVI
jgi:hypothetical protein